MKKIILIILLFFIPISLIAGPLQGAHKSVARKRVAGGSESSATVLDVSFEGGSEAARLKNLVDDSDPTTVNGVTNSTDPCANTFDYDTGGTSNSLIYAVSNLDENDVDISFRVKIPTYSVGDYLFYAWVDDSNYIYIVTTGNTIQASVLYAGLGGLLTATTLFNDSACHTVQLTIVGENVTLFVDDGGPEDTNTVSGTLAGTFSTVMWGIEDDGGSGLDAFLDDLYISEN